MGRPETGAMRFEGDWRGVFIRGDNAFGYAMYLKSVLDVDSPEKALQYYRAGLEGLVELLLSSDERSENPETQHMKSYADCVTSPPAEAQDAN